LDCQRGSNFGFACVSFHDGNRSIQDGRTKKRFGGDLRHFQKSAWIELSWSTLLVLAHAGA
jgi:hypothetical protein